MPKVEINEYGDSGYKNFVRKFARVVSAAAVPTVVWDGATPYEGWLAGEETLVIQSTSAEDAPGGAGVQYLEWTGQGEDGIEKVYSIELNGTTPVESLTLDPDIKWDVIYTAQCVNIEGSNLSPTNLPANRGTITIKSKTTNKIMAQINPGNGRTQMAIYRVPKNKYAEIRKLDVYPDANKPLVAEIWGRDNKNLSWVNFGPVDLENTGVKIDFPFGSYLSPGTDLCLVITPEQAATNCSSQIWIKKYDVENYDELLAKGQI